MKYILLILLFLFTFVNAKSILILNSYHASFDWTNNQVESFMKVLRTSGYRDADFYIEYLDTKRFPLNKKREKYFKEYLSKKYKNKKFDLIYSTDDNAINFLIKYKDKIFKTPAKVVFSGVNNLSLSHRLNRKEYTGIFERMSPKINVNIAKKVVKNLKKIYLIGDNSVTYKAIKKLFEQELTDNTLQYIYISNRNIFDITKKLKATKKGSVAMFLAPTSYVGKAGKFIPMHKAMEMISEAFQKPIIASSDAYIGVTNVIGGYCVSGAYQGKNAALLALKILANKDISKIKMLTKSPNQYIFDEKYISKFHLNKEIFQAFPDALIINKKFSFIRAYKARIISVFVVFLLLSVLLVLIYKKNRILKNTIDSIQVFTQATLSGVIVSDENFRCVDANDIALDLFGFTKDEIKGKYLLDFVQADYIPFINKKLSEADTPPSEAKLLKKDKSEFYAITRGKEVEINGKKRRISSIVDITHRKQLEDELQEINRSLEEKIKQALEQNTKQLELLQQQSKLASMGEMMGAIAHQWRQPLNAININIQNLDDDYDEGLIDAEFLDEFITKNRKLIVFMSKTIDDFRNFFRIDKEKQLFSVLESINEISTIQSAQLKDHNISLTIKGNDFEINGFRSEFGQVMLNIINNAKDVITDNKIENGEIDIILNSHKITITDNGGGIPKDIIDRVFEPYFTTKEQGKGTGMGLYMSKMIIEDNMGGKLSVENDSSGAKFGIYL